MVRRHRIEAARDARLVRRRGAGCARGRGQDQQCPGTLAIQAEILRARDCEQHLRDALREDPQARRVRLEVVPETLVGEVDERQQAALLDHLGDCGPLRRRKVGSGRVVAARMQQHDRAGRQLPEVSEHALEIHAMPAGVVVRVARERQSRVAEQRLVIRPGRVADVNDRPGAGRPHEIRTDPQRTATADGLDRRDSVAQPGREGSQRERADALVEFGIARRTDVGLRGLTGEHDALGLTDRGGYRRVAVFVAVHTDPEIDLVREGIGAKGGGHAEDRVRGQRLERGKHPRDSTRPPTPQRLAGRWPRRCWHPRDRTSRCARGRRRRGTA